MVDLLLKRKLLQVQAQVRNYYSAKLSMTATFLFKGKSDSNICP